MMKRIAALLLTLAVALCAALPVFAAGTIEVTEDVSVSDAYDWTRFKGQNVTLNVYNWGEYISNGSDDSVDVVDAFQKLTGIHVNYTTFDSNESLYAKMKSGGASYDVIFPSDYMVGKMIQEGMLAELDYSNIPNFSRIGEDYRGWSFDPDNAYSVPYTWGTTGIIYNTTMVDDPPTSWMDLFTADLKGQLLIFDNPRDCIGLALKALGYSFNTTDKDQIAEATDLLIKQKEAGIVQAYVMDQIFDKMINNEAAMGTYYAGDYLTMVEENPDLAFVQPEEGSNLFVDAMCIPTCSKNYEDALTFINFMCRDDIVLRNCEETGYSCPSATAMEEMDEDMATDPVAYPDADILDKAETFGGLPEDTLTFYDHEWIRICLAKVKY